MVSMSSVTNSGKPIDMKAKAQAWAVDLSLVSPLERLVALLHTRTTLTELTFRGVHGLGPNATLKWHNCPQIDLIALHSICRDQHSHLRVREYTVTKSQTGLALCLLVCLPGASSSVGNPWACEIVQQGSHYIFNQEEFKKELRTSHELLHRHLGQTVMSHLDKRSIQCLQCVVIWTCRMVTTIGAASVAVGQYSDASGKSLRFCVNVKGWKTIPSTEILRLVTKMMTPVDVCVQGDELRIILR